MPFPTFEGLGLGLVHLGHPSLPRNSPGAVTLVPTNFLFQKDSRRTSTFGGHHLQRLSALPSPPYPASLDTPTDSATIAATATPTPTTTTATATAMSTYGHTPFSYYDTAACSATTTPLSPPSPTLVYSTHPGICLPRPMSVEEVGQEPLSSPTPFLIPQIQPSFGEEQRQHRQSLPSFRQFVHQTHSPETPQSCHFPSSTHDRRHSLPSFGQLVAQIHDLEERRHLSSSTGLVASTPAAHPWKASDDIPLFSEHEDDGRTQMVVEEGTMTGTPHHVQRRQYPKKVDSISVLAAAAAEIEREADMFSGQTGAGHGHSNIQFGSTYHSPTTSVKSSSTDVSAKAPSEPATHRSSSSSGNSSSSSQHSTWLWRRPTDNQWVQRKQTSPPKRGRSEDYEDYEMTMIKQEEDNGTYGVGSSSMTKRSHIELPHKKRKSSLTFTHLASSRAASSSSSHRPIKRSTESMTDDTRSEMQSEGDDHYLFQQRHQQHPEPQPPKAKKKRMSKPKDPNYVSPSGFRHGGERRVQEPDEVVEMPEDVGPVSMLQGTNLPKVTWKGTPLPVDGKPGAERLHPHEAYIASTLRLSPAQYLLCKKTLILASRGFQSNHKVFRKTDAQKLCHVDVNKASKLWEVFTKIGWLAGSAEEDV